MCNVGMYLLQAFPQDKTCTPLMPFIKNSRLDFNKTLSNVQRYYGKKDSNLAVITEWERWERECIPKCDDVVRFVQE